MEYGMRVLKETFGQRGVQINNQTLMFLSREQIGRRFLKKLVDLSSNFKMLSFLKKITFGA